jgi:hypothetical protein
MKITWIRISILHTQVVCFIFYTFYTVIHLICVADIISVTRPRYQPWVTNDCSCTVLSFRFPIQSLIMVCWKPKRVHVAGLMPQKPKLRSKVITVGLNVHTTTKWITLRLIHGYFQITIQSYKVLKPTFTRNKDTKDRKQWTSKWK